MNRNPRDPRPGFRPPAQGDSVSAQDREPPSTAQAGGGPYAAHGSDYRPRPLVASGVGGASAGGVSGVGFGRQPAARSGGKKEIFCAFGVDVDAVAGWLGSYGGQDSPCDISRGLFSGEVGVPRLVRLFDRFGIKTSWFVPGHSIETFPDQF